MLRRVFVGCWTFWTGVVSLRAAEPPEVKTGFDLIPINAAGFAVHNLKELQTQGDRFVKNTDMEKHFGIRPSQAIPMIYGYLGLNKGRDDTLPAGIVIANLFESPVLSLSDFQDLEELDDNSKTHASHLQEAFGPDWSRIRLAVHGKKIVVLVRSNGNLFDETLANLDKKQPGLSEQPSLQEFQKRAPTDRRTEFHLILRQFLPMVKKGTKTNDVTTNELTSLSLGIGGDTIELHL